MFNSDPYTASGAYGFGSWTPATPGGVAVMPETQLGTTGNIPGAVLSKFTAHPANNPLFWLLAAALIWTGYVYGGFDVGVKNLFGTKTRVGR
jgi:hypothetical protein